MSSSDSCAARAREVELSAETSTEACSGSSVSVPRSEAQPLSGSSSAPALVAAMAPSSSLVNPSLSPHGQTLVPLKSSASLKSHTPVSNKTVSVLPGELANYLLRIKAKGRDQQSASNEITDSSDSEAVAAAPPPQSTPSTSSGRKPLPALDPALVARQRNVSPKDQLGSSSASQMAAGSGLALSLEANVVPLLSPLPVPSGVSPTGTQRSPPPHQSLACLPASPAPKGLKPLNFSNMDRPAAIRHGSFGIGGDPLEALSMSGTPGTPSRPPLPRLSLASGGGSSLSGGMRPSQPPSDPQPFGDDHPSIKKHLVRLSFLGQGACGSVFKAIHIPSLTIVAVKLIAVCEESKKSQLLNELKACRCNYVQLTYSGVPTPPPCPYIVSFYDAFSTKNKTCLVMEYLDEGSLADLLKLGPVPEGTLSRMAGQILNGLSFLANHHYIHRDIKPSNLLIHHNGDVKISDFGILKELDRTLATTETFVGTLSYMSPARLEGVPYGYESDIWSLGLVLFTLATGKYPYSTQKGYWELLYCLRNEPVPRLDPSQFSSFFCSFIEKCLQKDNRQILSAEQLLQHPFITNQATAAVQHSSTTHNESELIEIIDSAIAFFLLMETRKIEKTPGANDKAISFKRYNAQIISHLSSQMKMEVANVSMVIDKRFKEMEQLISQKGCLSKMEDGVPLGRAKGIPLDRLFGDK